MMKFNLKAKDIISIAVYSVLYFIVVALAAVTCVFILPIIIPFLAYPYLYIPVLAALLAGTIYMLLGARVQKFGAISLLALLMGIFFLFVFPYAFFISLFTGLVADGIAAASRYKNKGVLLISYLVFSLNLLGPILPMFIFPDFYSNQLLERGRDAAQIAETLSVASPQQGILLLVLTLAAALIGGYFGQKMVAKHFRKAGIV